MTVPPIHHDQILNGAKLLTGREVLRLNQDLIGEWKPQTDVWSLNYGSYVMAAIASASGSHVNHYFRNRLCLKGAGIMSTFFPNVIISGLLAHRVHEQVELVQIQSDRFFGTPKNVPIIYP